jgi:hypothetical protein
MKQKLVTNRSQVEHKKEESVIHKKLDEYKERSRMPVKALTLCFLAAVGCWRRAVLRDIIMKSVSVSGLLTDDKLFHKQNLVPSLK